MADNLEAGSMEQEAGENTNKPKSNKWLWWVLGIIIAAGIAGGAYYYWTKNKTTTTPSATTTLPTATTTTPATTTPAVTTPTTATTDPTADWKTLSLKLTGSKIKYSASWEINPNANSYSTNQTTSYNINYNSTTKVAEGWITEFNLSEWIKGPQPDEGYVLDKTQRNGLLDVIKELYTEGKITEEIKQKLNGYSSEFMTYSSLDRVYMDYLANKDNTAKGLSMINTHGQDTGLGDQYMAVLYDKEKNSVLTIEKNLSSSEINNLRKEYGDYTSPNLVEIDKQVHKSFTDLINNTQRDKLSFASQMNDVNNAITSWSY